jgi:hypothetical protein
VSIIKCSFCEYRNFHAAETCINCGSPLFPQPPVGQDPSAKNKPAPGSRPLPNQPPAPGSRPLPNQPPAPGSRPLPNQPTVPRSRPLSGEQSAPRSKPISNQPPAPRNRSISNQPTVPRSRPLSGEQSAPRSRPISNQPPAPRDRPISNQPPAPRDRPLPNQSTVSKSKSLSSEESVPRKSSSSSHKKTKRLTLPKAPEPDPEPGAEIYSEAAHGEQSLEHGPYSNDNSYSETGAEIYSEIAHGEQFLEHGLYSNDDSYSETGAEIYSEIAHGEQFLEHGLYSNHDPYSETGAEIYFEVAHGERSLEHGSEPHSDDEAYSRGIVPYQLGASSGVVPINPNTALEPYKVSKAVEQYQPQGILPTLPTRVKEDKRPPHDKSQLPWGLPRRDPDVAGMIILIQQSQELPEYPNVIVGLTNLLTELIWLIPNDTMRKEEERLQVTTLRIRCENDERKDIRLIGYLRGANLTLGDEIWCWGWHRKGSLIARKGYNWTSKAVVTTHTLGLIVPALTLLILLGIGFLMFLAWPSISSVVVSAVHSSANRP